MEGYADSDRTYMSDSIVGKSGIVHLSIDKDLQITVYRILEQNLAGIIASNQINAKKFDKTHISDTTDIITDFGPGNVIDVPTALRERLEQRRNQKADRIMHCLWGMHLPKHRK